MTRRYYSNTAAPVTLTGAINAAATTVTVTSASGFPSSFPWTAALERATAQEELVLVTAGPGPTYTITRGYGGTTGKTHASATVFEHVVDATDADEANAHVVGTTGVHGAAGAVVGTTDTQTLTNKTLSSSKGLATASDPGLVVQAAATGTAALIRGVDSAGSTTVAQITQGGGFTGSTAAITATSASADVVTGVAAASHTGKLLRLRTSTPADIAVVDKDGKLALTPVANNSTGILVLKSPVAGTAANPLEVQSSAGTVVGRIGPAGDFVSTGFQLNANGGFPKLNTADNKFVVDSNSNVVMAGAAITADGAAANNFPTTPQKTGKKMHWGSATVTTDGSGYANVTHGAGFTPTVVVICWAGQSLGGGLNPVGADTYGSTTFRIRGAVSSSITVGYICLD